MINNTSVKLLLLTLISSEAKRQISSMVAYPGGNWLRKAFQACLLKGSPSFNLPIPTLNFFTLNPPHFTFGPLVEMCLLNMDCHLLVPALG